MRKGLRKLKLFLVITCLSVPLHRAAAVTLVEFDTPYIFVEIAVGKINGYYGLRLPEVDERPSPSCEFFMMSDSLDLLKHDAVKIRTFYTEDTF